MSPYSQNHFQHHLTLEPLPPLRITSRLGSGNFGHVESGLWHSPVGVIKVAMKSLKENSTENDKVKFLQEAAINGQFYHRNIVKLLGVITVTEPVSA